MPLKLEDSRGYAWERRTKSSHRDAGKQESSKGDGDRSRSIMEWVAGKRSPSKRNDQREQSWNIADHEEGFRISAELYNANRR